MCILLLQGSIYVFWIDGIPQWIVYLTHTDKYIFHSQPTSVAGRDENDVLPRALISPISRRDVTSASRGCPHQPIRSIRRCSWTFLRRTKTQTAMLEVCLWRVFARNVRKVSAKIREHFAKSYQEATLHTDSRDGFPFPRDWSIHNHAMINKRSVRFKF